MKSWIVAASALLAFAAQAQTLNGVKIEPANAKVGETVKITTTFDPAENVNCGFRLRFGDGTEQLVKVNQANEVPHVVSRSYARAGQFKVEADPVKVGGSFKCAGKPQSAILTVAAPAPAPAAAAPAPAAAPAAPAAAAAQPAACPTGWTLAKPGVNKKTQAFTCTAKAGTKIPEPKVTCSGDLTYFENSKKGQLGCRV